MKKDTEVTAQRAEEFDIPGQKEGESDDAFRERVSSALLDRGCIVESHEAKFNDVDDSDPTALIDNILGQCGPGQKLRQKR